MKKIIALSIIVICAHLLHSQPQKLQLHDKKFSLEIEKEKEEGSLSDSRVAYYYTYIGKYQKALESYELPLEWNLSTITHDDSIKFLNYKAVNAEEYIAERLKEEAIVIISEAHHKPQHRVFTTELLDELYENGFRYLGLETLTPNYVDESKYLMDTLLNERGYPLNSPLTGFFTREPQMANLLRKASELGFTIFGYESINRALDRDLSQAINIHQFMEEHHEGKVVIHCGWYHAIESDYPKKGNDYYMAHHLKNLTGIDPLTIYQDALTEKATEIESPYYGMIHADEVSVLLDEEGNLFNGMDEHQHFDMFIFHPRTTYVKKRENWLYKPEEHHFMSIDKTKIDTTEYPIIVEAIPVGEYNSVPVDIIELDNESDSTALILKKGNYRIRMMNKDRKIEIYEIEVK